MRQYTGISNPRECEFEVTVNGKELNPRLDLRNHSPTGLSWGYAGSGPAQCALAILADAFDDATAVKYYQRFKQAVISTLPESWMIDTAWLEKWLKQEHDQ